MRVSETAALDPTRARPEVLVIVESPAKAGTIGEYLGSGYKVLASKGHLIDLPKSRLGIDVEGGFEPEYRIVRGKAKLLKELRSEARKSKLVLLASDCDREGEAIAFHIGKALEERGSGRPIERIVFNEITPDAIRAAVGSPRAIDDRKVEAQKARRVLDRLVGYNLSPLLWRKVKNGLSAGRVQSVALRLVCEREAEVEAFVPEEYWTIEARFRKGRRTFSAELAEWEGEEPRIRSGSKAAAIVSKMAAAKAVAGETAESDLMLAPRPPFTTARLLQEAADKLGFSSAKTMQVAQQLYEGLDIGSGRVGLITYLRTDSVRVADSALAEVRAYIGQRFPAELPPGPRSYADSASSQGAHEAIRPTIVSCDPPALKGKLGRDQLRLYCLVWERFVASQMNDARLRASACTIAVGAGSFRLRSERVAERGFLKVARLGASKDRGEELAFPELRSGEEIPVEGIEGRRRFTRGPERYTEASIVGALEEAGIGRPSTYAPTVSVLVERYYVSRTHGLLAPTVLGRMINDILVERFPELVDTRFTAGMEEMLDEVEERRADWVARIREFYGPFKRRVDEVMESLGSSRGSLDEPTDIVCEKCGKPFVKKLGRFGYFLACSGFPECRNTRSVPLAKCPRPGCGGDIVARKRAAGRGREFYGCTNYPNCDFVCYDKPIKGSCPECGWFLVEKFDRKGGARKACINPGCDYLHERAGAEEVDHER